MLIVLCVHVCVDMRTRMFPRFCAPLVGAVQSNSTATTVRKHSSDCGCVFGQYASLTGASLQLGVFAKLRGNAKARPGGDKPQGEATCWQVGPWQWPPQKHGCLHQARELPSMFL